MATMKEMAAAKLVLRIKKKKAMGDSPAEINALQDVRETQRLLLDGYYEIPRTSKDAAVGCKARSRTRKITCPWK